MRSAYLDAVFTLTPLLLLNLCELDSSATSSWSRVAPMRAESQAAAGGAATYAARLSRTHPPFPSLVITLSLLHSPWMAVLS